MPVALLTRQRLSGLDVLRGGLLILVMLYHLCYDLSSFFGVDTPWLWSVGGQLVRMLIAGSLMVISGVSCSLSRSNLKRGLKTTAVALALTVGTALASPDIAIWFGVVHYFGVMMLLYALLGKYIERIPTVIGVSVFLLLFLLCFNIPQARYNISGLFWLGFPSYNFASSDYYPLLPWGFLFLAGSLLGHACKEHGFPPWIYALRCPPLERIGQHSLLVYLVHQPLVLGGLYLFWQLAGRG